MMSYDTMSALEQHLLRLKVSAVTAVLHLTKVCVEYFDGIVGLVMSI